MRLLLDSSVWGPSAVALRRAGHDVVWVGDWSEDPGDSAILVAAHRDRRILVTLDKDFGELAVRHGAQHAGIVRLVDVPAPDQARRCLEILDALGSLLQAGSIVTATMTRVRIRPSGEEAM